MVMTVQKTAKRLIIQIIIFIEHNKQLKERQTIKSDYTIERTLKTGNGFKERLKVKAFKTSEAMHKFLNTGRNALHWKQSNKGFKSGLYAFAGGQWHNVKTLDASILNHI